MNTNSLIYNRILYIFATCISVSVSRLGLTGEGKDQVTLMHHGCWRTHMHTARHPLSHPISLSLSHTPLWADALVRVQTTAEALLYCALATCEQSAVRLLENHFVSKNKLKPCTIAEGLAEVKQWQGSKFQFKLRVMRYPAVNYDKIGCWQES